MALGEEKMKATKKSIVLLSGWLHNFENETEFVDELSKNFNVTIIKYPGYYGEKDLERLPKKFDLADYIYSKIKSLKLKDYTFVSFSMGCQVALHVIKKYDLTNKVILISPTTSDLTLKVPFLLKPFLKNELIFGFIRENEYLSKLIVNMAYKKISVVTENGKVERSNFNNKNITTKGAFDTLYFLITNFIDPIKYSKQTSLIFGDKEILQKSLKPNEYWIIKDCGHGGFEKRYKEFSKTIISLVTV